jgi:hypothetical protein
MSKASLNSKSHQGLQALMAFGRMQQELLIIAFAFIAG